MSIKNQTVANSVIPLPDPADPGRWICVEMMIPDSLGHRAAFLGAISNLGQWRVWQRDIAHNGTIVAELWRKARRSVRFVTCKNPLPAMGVAVELPGMSDLVQVICDSNNKCILQYRCDTCSDWITVASIDDLTKLSTPGVTNTQPPPNGGTQQTCTTMYANAQLPIPVTVSPGDEITLNSASGSWWDGGEFDFGPLWRVPNGDQFVGGFDVGFPLVTGTDPVVAARHMVIIAAIGATPTYIELPLGTPVTVPAVTPGSQLFLQVNDTAISNNEGSAAICVTVKNNSAGTWSRTLDFRLSPQSFVSIPLGGINYGSWVNTAGWESVPYPPGGASATTLAIHRTFPSSHFTSASITCSQSPAATGGGAGNTVQLRSGGSAVANVAFASVFNGTQTDSWSGSVNADEILINPSGASSPQFIEIQMVIAGTGTPPF